MGFPNLTFCVAVLVALAASPASAVDKRKFPDELKIGTSSAALQIEGGWNADGKGQNIWDHMMFTNPNFTSGGVWGDVACDSYHNWERDVEMLKEIGVDAYRFSIQWSRVLPSGYTDKINQPGVDYYNNLISALVKNNIVPMVTLYHWDLPQPLQNIGGWPNPKVADAFADWADTAFRLFGDRVKYWITFNEPYEVCVNGYAWGSAAPAISQKGIADYECAHTVLRGHAMAYRLYQKKYAAQQKGKIGMSFSMGWEEPKDPNSEKDRAAADRALQFHLGWFAHPIWSKEGNYPQVMIDRVETQSKKLGRKTSRLPVFTQQEIDDLRGSSDFFGLNHYTTELVHEQLNGYATPSREDDAGYGSYQDPSWPASSDRDWIKVVPWGFRKILVWIKDQYNNPPVYITENGYGDNGETNDQGRISYHRQYLEEMLNAIYDYGCNVVGYHAWSLMDSWEWRAAFWAKFGLFKVNFKDPKRTRTPKASVKWFNNLIKTRRLPDA